MLGDIPDVLRRLIFSVPIKHIKYKANVWKRGQRLKKNLTLKIEFVTAVSGP